MKSYGVKFLVALVAIIALAGCSTLSNLAGNVDQAKLVVQIATMKVVESKTDRVQTATRIVEITDAAQKMLDVSAVSVEALKFAAQSRIMELKLAPSDQLLANLLVDAVTADLIKRVGDGVIPQDKRVRVNTVLAWVSDTAALYKR